MFTHHVQHSKNAQTSIFSYRNQPSLIRPEQGYHNIDSPLKAALRLQTSPRRNLSPLRYQTQTDSKLNNRRSRSPIIFSKRDGMSPGNTRVSPLRKVFQPQQNYGPQKHISFTNLIRKNSNTGNYESQAPQQFNRTLEYSGQNYLQSDRNFRQDTNLFKKLADMIKSNKSNNESSFLNSGLSDNSVKFKGMPQSCKNQYSNSNKKMFIKNVMTVESIQSPEERDYGWGWEGEYENVETRCYQEYERMTERCVGKEKKDSVDWCREGRAEKREGKKDTAKVQAQLQEFEALSFKKISYGNDQKLPNERQDLQPKQTRIDYHLTNSFGTTTLNLKNQIMGQSQKPPINPFQQMSQQIQQIESINRSVDESQDSMFASLQMLLSKVNGNNKVEEKVERQNESINVSIVDEGSQLDMEPFLEKRK